MADTLCACIDSCAKDAEIERLRAALESLTKDPPATLDEPDPDCEVITKMRAIARAALECAEAHDQLNRDRG